MTNYSQLLKALSAQQSEQIKEFQTTKFWEYAANELSAVLERDEIHNFRDDPACLTYFVPTYGYPAMGLDKSQLTEIKKIADKARPKQKNTIDQFISGHNHANADHRAIQGCVTALGYDPFLTFDESKVGNPSELFTFNGKNVSRPAHNYMLGLLFLISHERDAALNSVVEVGGGHGVLGEILFKSSLGTDRYINFDIPPTCIFAEYYLSKVLPELFASDLSSRWNTPMNSADLSGLHVRPNWDISSLNGPVDLFVNYHSFQEMEPAVVQKYIEEISRLRPSFLLLRNIREGKQVTTANKLGVETPTKAENYIDWLRDEFHLVEQNSRTFGFVTADNFHSELSLWKRK
ncbi:putative sugar O-methyltransferase [Litorivicinus sp.]|nr:putative sugar O-methyltransferase [Litorivicinus sp.]MDB9862138.1 putative sugar O-methyltransferase [Litorivicinus sp.]MDC1209017.1 putative sugar O-methyltransferase [Litorivicinus sp.]MDC1466777.1 putative sugar O-methyltransferase [Litorivicinus sp.]